MSAASRIASVVSLNHDGAVDDDEVVARGGAPRGRACTAVGVISSAISGDGGASRTRTPAEWLMTNVSSDSGSPASSSGTRSAIDLFFGFRLSRTPTSPNWNEPSIEDDRLAELGRRGDREVDRDRRPADAALRAEDRDDLAVVVAVAAAGAAPPAPSPDHRPARGHPALLLLLARVDLADRGGELVAAERLDEELARAGEHRPAEVVRLALDRHHHDRGGRDLRRRASRSRRCRPCPAC